MDEDLSGGARPGGGSVPEQTGLDAASLDHISLRGLRARGRHGVFAAEQELGQVFVVDLQLALDTRRAAVTDDLSHTVDYGALAEAVVARVAGTPVALLERLAAEIADICLANALVRRVTVDVHKPGAPVSVPFDDVVVTITRGR